MKTWALALFTLKESLKSRTVIAGLIVSLVYLTLIPALSTGGGGISANPAGAHGPAGEDFLSLALAGLNMIGMAMAVFISLGAIREEIDSGMISIIIAKPVRRWQVFVGKWAGHSMLMGVYVLAVGLVLWLPVAVGTGDRAWSFMPALLLTSLNVITLVTLTMALSIAMPAVANAVSVFIIFALTSSTRIADAISTASGSVLTGAVANLLRMLLPVGQVGSESNMLLSAKSVPGPAFLFMPPAWSFLYELLYIAAVIALATYFFARMDLG